MNIQTERLENHTVRLTVELTLDDLDKAKKQAATKLSNQYKIPGFRKGKAPYNIVSKFVGEGTILEEAIETLGNSVYPKALDESKILPYAAGNMEDFKIDPVPTYVFTFPMQPEVELGEYQSVRVDYELPEINEDALERTLEALRQQAADTQEVEGEIAVGHRVTVDIHSHFDDGEENPLNVEGGEDDHDHDHDDDDDEESTEDGKKPFKGDDFFHRHDAVLNLNPDNEPVLGGFIEKMVGNKAGDDIEFDLTVSENDEAHKDIVGRTIHFHVQIKKVENVELPELDDAFAAKLTASEETPLDFAQLKVRVQENLQHEANTEYGNKYADLVLDKIMEGATVSFPEVMVKERAEEMVKDFVERLKQQHISLEVYQSVTGMGKEQLTEQYRSDAEKYVKRSLVLGEVLVHEQISLTNAEIDAEVNILSGQFGDQVARFRQFLNSKEQRENIANRLLFSKVMERLVTIGKGEYLKNEERVAEDEASSVISATPDTESDND